MNAGEALHFRIITTLNIHGCLYRLRYVFSMVLQQRNFLILCQLQGSEGDVVIVGTHSSWLCTLLQRGSGFLHSVFRHSNQGRGQLQETHKFLLSSLLYIRIQLISQGGCKPIILPKMLPDNVPEIHPSFNQPAIFSPGKCKQDV